MQLKRNLFSAIASLAVFCLCVGVAQAQWEWTDKDGRKVFSDRAPPTDIPETNILKRPVAPTRPSAPARPVTPAGQADADQAAAAAGPAAAASAAASRPGVGGVRPAVAVGTDRELQERKRKADEAAEAAKKAQEDAVAKTRAENCARARQAKAGIDSGMRLARTNAKGEREVLDDAARAAETRRLQAVINSECG